MRTYFLGTIIATSLAFSPCAFAQDEGKQSGAPQPTEMNSPAMLIAGSVTGGLGLVALSAGLIVPATMQEDEDGMSGAWIGIGGLALGGTMLLVGIPLIIAGAWQIPVDDNAAVSVGPGGASFRLAF